MFASHKDFSIVAFRGLIDGGLSRFLGVSVFERVSTLWPFVVHVSDSDRFCIYAMFAFHVGKGVGAEARGLGLGTYIYIWC